ncbi:cytochrome b6-f complex iron-sulfur subunit, chloroplastic [Olea europaea subsp. europaea]|uniref:Cytochrome b6-f complex iron-sulfur subunit, chloroplastic n=1 Tax=Olea europaea subsp. europaea TaxID=158383 RepID=A0A8S0TLS1_OLEEU|nr:cytochrome b6-f complex iron-sulfur subunit, chloroplastic [Olea europaea subsp. europaea]
MVFQTSLMKKIQGKKSRKNSFRSNTLFKQEWADSSMPTCNVEVPKESSKKKWKGSGGAGGGQVAKDALGNDVIASASMWLKNHGPGDRTLTQGLKGDPTYLVVENDRTLATCGRVVRGPAPLSLSLAHADVDDGKVVFVPWVETDFRTGDAPWWA